jgi:hypothetical protein
LVRREIQNAAPTLAENAGLAIFGHRTVNEKLAELCKTGQFIQPE